MFIAVVYRGQWLISSKADEEGSGDGSKSAQKTESEAPGEFRGGGWHVSGSEGVLQGGKYNAGDGD